MAIQTAERLFVPAGELRNGWMAACHPGGAEHIRLKICTAGGRESTVEPDRFFKFPADRHGPGCKRVDGAVQ